MAWPCLSSARLQTTFFTCRHGKLVVHPAPLLKLQDWVHQYAQHRFSCHADSLQLYELHVEVFWASKDEFVHFLEWARGKAQAAELLGPRGSPKEQQALSYFSRGLKTALPEAKWGSLGVRGGNVRVCHTMPAQCAQLIKEQAQPEGHPGSPCNCFSKHVASAMVEKEGLQKLPLAASNLNGAGFELLDDGNVKLLFSNIMLTNLKDQGNDARSCSGAKPSRTCMGA